MEITPQEVIDRARMYANDDMNDNKGALLKPARWFQLFNSLYKRLYRQWLRAGLISPAPVDEEFTGPQVRLRGVLAIQGVVRCTIKGYRDAVVDLYDYVEQVTNHTYYRLKEYIGSERPTFTVAPGMTASLVMVGNAITLTYDPNSTTVNDVNDLVFASDFMELVRIPGVSDETVLDDLKSAQYWAYDARALGGEVLMSEYQTLWPEQRFSRDKRPFGIAEPAPGMKWTATGLAADEVTVRLTPPDDSAQSYVVRYYEVPEDVTATTDTVVIPDGADNYLALKLAKMAAMTEGGFSRSMEKEIIDEEAQLGFTAAAMLPPRLKAGKSTPRVGPNGFPLYPSDWIWQF